MLDISDGLSTDLPRLCSASDVGAVVSDVPVNSAVLQAALATEEDPEAWALNGGEDYELLIAVERRAFKHLATRYKHHFGRELRVVGRCTPEREILLEHDGSRRPLIAGGWDSFSR